MRDKEQFCLSCHQPLKYSGSHIFYCKSCHKRFRFLKTPDYKLDKKGNPVKDMMGRLLHSGKFKTSVVSWDSVR